MTEQELRALVRQAIAHHLPGAASVRAPLPGGLSGPPAVFEAPVTFHRQHVSHAMFSLPAEPGGPCIIEPTVICNHCGFCKSFGH